MADLGNTFDVSQASFQDDVLDSELPVLVDFWATWCQPCRMIEPHVVSISNEYAADLRVARVDADANGELLMQYGVMGIPTLILFKNGEEVERITGFKPKDQILNKLKAYLS